ncbi:MAG TPA: T9SS type A sorting domain-containing protein [Lentimicrobium sp.]|nr:T9SS type A sorting domain-containing protein [Lentimicrobium sp.]
MKHFLHLSSLLTAVLVINTVQAQFVVKDSYFNATGVSNQGIVSGYEAQAGPYSLWDPIANTTISIGGAAPGQGVGGNANFSADGNLISGTNYDVITFDPQWERNVLNQYSYIFTDIEFPPYQDQRGFAAAQTLTYDGNGLVLRTEDGGETWEPVFTDNQHHGIETMSFPDYFTGFIAGWNGFFAKTTDGGTTWNPSSPATGVYMYTAMAFKDELNGVLTAQLDMGTDVYLTSDGGASWQTGSGLAAIPYKITYVSGDTYFLVTNDGQIQKSTNNGLNWTTVYDAPGMLLGIAFYDDMTGIATGEDYFYMTTDGGLTWIQRSIPGTSVLWRDVAWSDANHIILTGTPDAIYESHDGGATWFWANESIFTGEPALYDIFINGSYAHICGSQGNFYKKSVIYEQNIAEMSVYNTTTQEWSFLGNLGFTVDNTRSSGYNISSDGSTIVGNSWADPALGNGTTLFTHGVAWNEEEGLIDLGSIFDSINRSTRANAVSGDGSVVVGFQDYNGPWKAAYWKKNPDGGYFPNQYLLLDPRGDSLDEYNQLGYAGVVSDDGLWVGGDGDYATNDEPWIWSEATGYQSLGRIADGPGNVNGINEDGSVVVGWFNVSMWDPSVPFIWIKGSMMNLNDYIADTLGFAMANSPTWAVSAMSKNGKYVTGWGYDPTIGTWGDYFTWWLDLSTVTKTGGTQPDAVSVYPNPATNLITVNSNQSIDHIEIYNVSGQLAMTVPSVSRSTSVDISSLTKGIYLIKTISDETIMTRKFVKR